MQIDFEDFELNFLKKGYKSDLTNLGFSLPEVSGVTWYRWQQGALAFDPTAKLTGCGAPSGVTTIGKNTGHYGSEAFKSTHWGKNHSLNRPLAPQHSVTLRSVPLRFAPLRAAPLAGSFVSEKVAIY